MLESDNSLKSVKTTPLKLSSEELPENPKLTRQRHFSGLSLLTNKHSLDRRFSIQLNINPRDLITKTIGRSALFNSMPSATPQKSLSDYHINQLKESIGISQNIEDLKNKLKVNLTDINSRLNSLEAQGFVHLTKILHDKTGYPWNCILTIEDPGLIEQLVLLYQVIERKKEGRLDNCGDHIFLFALLSCQNILPESIEETLSMIGKIIFLSDNNLILITNNVVLDHVEKTVDWIDTQFHNEIQHVQRKMRLYYDAHAKSQLQDPDVASSNQLPIELAKLIITDTGLVNIGVIQPLIDIFIKEKDSPLNYEVSLTYSLKLLKTNPKLRDKFLKINKMSEGQSADQLISIIMDYPRQTVLSEVDSRRAALAGLLSHLRQTPSGSCFATCLAIELLSSQLGQCLDDFIEIIQTSRLTRKLNGSSMEFPYIVSAQNKALEAPFVVDFMGTLKTSENTSHIWEAPGIIAACHAMGIIAVQRTIEKVLQSYFHDLQNTEQFKPITVDEFLRLLAEYAFENKLNVKDKADVIFKKGGFAFDSQTSNALLNAWMNSIANMSEAISSSMIKSQIFKALSASIDATELGCPMTLNKIKLSFYSNLSKEFFKRIRLEYDPSIKGSGFRTDNYSIDGAFVLYDRGTLTSSNNWTRIDKPAAFQEFLMSLLDISKTSMDHLYCMGSNIKFLDIYIQELRVFIKSDVFLIKLLQSYDPLHAAGKSTLDELLKLPYTPWITKSGNDSIKTLQVYLEREVPCNTEKASLPTAEVLLQKIIGIGRNMPKSEKSSYLVNPNKLIPLRLQGVHAFSLMLGHPTLISSWKDSLESLEWMKVHVLEPGKKIANGEIGPVLYHSLVQHCLQNLIPKEQREKFIRAVKHSSDRSTIIVARNRLLDLVESFSPLEGDLLHERARKFDTFLYQNLQGQNKYLLEKSAIHFADTNWADGIHDIHFCFVVNPGTGQLEMWESLDDGTLSMALNQWHWVFKHTWEFYSNPVEILPNNEGLSLKKSS